jgi:hypothetical protein
VKIRWARLAPGPLVDPAQRGPLLGWLGVGLAVRFALMPFAVSADLLAVYWRSHLIAYDGRVFGSYLVNMGAHYVHAASLRLLAWLLPAPHVVWTHPWWWADFSALAPQTLRWFSTQPWTYQTLFVLKTPYLAADLGAGLVLLALLGRTATPRATRRAWAFWMLSPIGLYASYVFGRYEMFPVVLVLGALLACERGRPWLGAVLLGFAVTMRIYPLLLVPIFGLVVRRRPSESPPAGSRSTAALALEQAAWAAVALAPFGLVMGMNRVLAGSVGELERLKDFSTGSTLLAYAIPVDGPGQLHLFVLFAALVYGTMIGRGYGWWGRGPLPVEQLWVWLFVFHAGMFAFATFSAHYLAWLTPFVALAIGRRPAWRGTLPLHLLQCGAALAFADLVGGSAVTVGLFQPLQPELATAWPNLQEAFLTSHFSAQLAGILRTGLVALALLLAVPAVIELAGQVSSLPQSRDRERHRSDQQPEPAQREAEFVAEQPSAR